MIKIILFSLFLIGCNQQNELIYKQSYQALPHSESLDQINAYYDEIIENENNMREALFLAISLKHLAFDNELDQLTTECSIENKNCFGHREFSYRQIRKELFTKIDLKHDQFNQPFVEDIYCGKLITENIGPHEVPKHTILNAEHLWPQARFSSIFSKNLQKADLHHLVPVLSKANSKRGNLHFAEVNNPLLGCEQSGFGKINGNTFFEPPNRFKGDISRALFYFAVRYRLPIDDMEESFLRKWHQEDPVSDEEKLRHQKIFEIQENRNPFIDRPYLVYLIENF